MKAIDVATIVPSDRALLEVIMLLEQGKFTQLPVVRENGVVVGILEKGSIISLLEKQAQAHPA